MGSEATCLPPCHEVGGEVWVTRGPFTIEKTVCTAAAAAAAVHGPAHEGHRGVTRRSTRKPRRS